ncbi:MAG: carbohydrate porin [Pirellulaceae bacterium]|nr:carbohydrate porin [Pirellulaceae bacterium]
MPDSDCVTSFLMRMRLRAIMAKVIQVRAWHAAARLFFAVAVTCGNYLYSQTESDYVTQASDASSAIESNTGCLCDDSCDGLVSGRLCSDDLTLSSWLDGDQSKLRQGLSDNGITFTNNLTNFYFGNTRGGLEREFRFGGHGDYLTNIDINKLGGPQGQFLQIRAEHRYGESLAGSTGTLLPPNLATDLPVADSDDIYITNFLFTQALSESFALYAGKLDTLDGDMNAFAHGRGIRQFSNAAFVVNPIGLRTVAYSTLGTGFVFLKDREPIYNFLVLNARDTTTSDGFSELFADGAVISQELRIPTNLLGLPGHQLFGAIWSSRNFAALDQSPLIVLPRVPIARESGSWALTYNFDQYLFVDPCDSKRGWGLFGRVGVADPNTNPIQSFYSLGVGGNSRLRGRENDTFGLGWYYSETSKNIAPFLANLGNLRDGQGGEMFYSVAVRKRFTVTADTQVLLPARANVDTALTCGLRANLTF